MMGSHQDCFTYSPCVRLPGAGLIESLVQPGARHWIPKRYLEEERREEIRREEMR